ncbi:MAG: arginine--tRNA ligase, partial [Bacteroidales bacterium]|nr:arginine--tRNA ligase [Bacteroidales bacterium]
MQTRIEETLQNIISNVLKELYNIDAEENTITLQKTKKEFTGDLTLVVFPFVKAARKAPEAVANEIGAAVAEKCPMVASFNVIKGFLNFEINKDYWVDFVMDNADVEKYGFKLAESGKAPIVVEYSSPNTNKPLHLGHIRNNLLGWSVSELLKADGNNVKKVNLVNDRGIHICKSMLAWLKYGNG